MKLLKRDTEIVLEPDGALHAAVVWLHGLGADGSDFVPIVPELGLPRAHGIRFIFPHAPVRPVTINGGMPMRAWYDIPSLTNLRQQDEAGIRDSERIVNRYLAQQRGEGLATNRLLLAGFSQGGAITLHCGLRQPEPLAGLLALSTYLPLADRLPEEAAAPETAPPILMCHGRQDPVLPMLLGSGSRDALTELGYAVTWREYDMAHAVCAEQINDIGAWLAARLLA